MLIDLPSFSPHPLVRGGHLQTVVGTYLPSPMTAAPRSPKIRMPLSSGSALLEKASLMSLMASATRAIPNAASGDAHTNLAEE